MFLVLLLLVPVTAMALVLGMGRLEDTLLAPPAPADEPVPTAPGGAAR